MRSGELVVSFAHLSEAHHRAQRLLTQALANPTLQRQFPTPTPVWSRAQHQRRQRYRIACKSFRSGDPDSHDAGEPMAKGWSVVESFGFDADGHMGMKHIVVLMKYSMCIAIPKHGRLA